MGNRVYLPYSALGIIWICKWFSNLVNLLGLRKANDSSIVKVAIQFPASTGNAVIQEWAH